MNSGLYDSTLGRFWDSGRIPFAILGGVVLLWIALLHAGPIIQMINISFMKSYPHQGGAEYTLANYAIFFADSLYFMPFVRSLLISAVVTLSTLVIVYPIAYYVAKIVRPQNRVRALLLLLIPFWAGELIRTFSVIMLLSNRGAINVLLRQLGMIDTPIPMLYTTFSLSFGIVYLLALFMLLPLYSALERIPASVIDAAADLGAGPLQRFWRVILPLSRDGIVSGCALVYLSSIGAYTAPLLLGGPSATIFPEVISALFHTSNESWPAGAAFSVLLLGASLTTVGLFMRLVGGRAIKML
ncbi:ABC transporter permease [Devosia sp. A369]